MPVLRTESLHCQKSCEVREAPIKLEPEKVKSEEEIEEENRIKAERAKAKEAAILANLK